MKKLLIFLVLVALGLTGLAYYTKIANPHPGEDQYPTMPVAFGDLNDVISVNALVSPLNTKPVFSMISGQVVSVAADYNQEVGEGDVLLRLDDRQARFKHAEASAALAGAKAAVDAAKKELERVKAARTSAQRILVAVKDTRVGSVDKIKAEEGVNIAEKAVASAESAVKLAESKVESAKVAVEQADLGVKLTTIAVPSIDYTNGNAKQPDVGAIKHDGQGQHSKRKYIVLDRNVKIGQNVDTKLPLFTLAGGLDQMQAHALIPESQITRVTKGQHAAWWTDALGEENKRDATVSDIRPMPANQGQQQGAIYYTVLLDLPNQRDKKTNQWELRPGMTVKVEITDQTHKGVWKLPVNAKNFQLDESLQTAEAKNKLQQRDKLKNSEDWVAVWVLKDKKPWPIFARIGGVNAKGESGIKDAEYYEVLDWDPELKPTPDAKRTETYPQVLIGAPAKPSGFKLPKINPFS